MVSRGTIQCRLKMLHLHKSAQKTHAPLTAGTPALYACAMDKNIERFAAAPFIKEIGRGVKGARSMSREDARALYAAMLEGRVSDLELGAILLAMRIKGESVEELAGFMDAAVRSNRWSLTAATWS